MSEAVIQRLKISREGVILIKSFEGFRPRAIRRDDGQWVIGYGHTLSAREGASVAESDAELLLQYDLIPVAKAVNEGVAAPLNQHQFDALASFAFSVGVDRFQTSDVLSRLNAGFAGEAADALIGWPEPVLPETALRRRAAERALFVANPGLPVALADLLAAPLPPPYRGPVEPPVPTPAASVEPEVPAEYLAPDLAQDAGQEVEEDATQEIAPNARHAAVAALLAEPAPVLHAPEAETVEVETAEPQAPEADTPEPAIEAAPVETPVEAPVELPAEAEQSEASSVADAAPPEPSVTPAPAPVSTPQAFSGVMPMQRYAAYSGVIVGPLPGPAPSLHFSPPADSAAVPAPVVDVAAAEAPVADKPVADTPVAEVPVTVEADEPEAVNPFTPALIAEETPAEEAPVSEPASEVAAEAVVEAPAEPEPAQTEATQAEATPAVAWFVDAGSAIAAAPAEAQADPFAHAPAPAPAVEPAVEPASEPEATVVATEEPAHSEVEPEARLEVETELQPEAPAAAVTFDAPAEPNPFALPPAPFPAATFSDAPARLELPVFGASASLPTADPWPAISATSEPRTDGELVLTPSPEAEVFASPRLVWPHGEQTGDDTPPLFEDDGSLRLAPGNILRHEVFDDAGEPARIPWGELAAYGVMGGFGLVSFGMSMAAFRRAAGESSGGDGTILIAVVLAVVGAACVGVSAYNLYRRWGRTDEE